MPATSSFDPEDNARAHYNTLQQYLVAYLAKRLYDFAGAERPLEANADLAVPASSRLNAREKLTRLTTQQFQELSTDVYDELKRRMANSRLGHDIPYLPPRDEFQRKRNLARQKLATLPTSRFEDLSSDVHFELSRRHPEFREENEAEMTPVGSTDSSNDGMLSPEVHTTETSRLAATETFRFATDLGSVPAMPLFNPKDIARTHHDELQKYLVSYLVKLPADSRSVARQKLARLTIQQFHELSTDVYDELIRRKANTSESEIPYLPPHDEFHPKRNQARQKLAALPTYRFEDLSSDVHFELSRRYPEFKKENEAGTAPVSSPDSSKDGTPSLEVHTMITAVTEELSVSTPSQASTQASIENPVTSTPQNDVTDQISRHGRDPVASGGFADIYRGKLHDNGEFIEVAIKAIKTYSGEDCDSAKKLKRLRREMKVWLDLKHDNVLPLLGTTMGFSRFPAMVCPWAKDGTLTSYLENRYDCLSVLEILSLLNNIAAGLQYLHSRSVVHGDLSGSNVLICSGGRACIADFGLSMLLTELGGPTFATSFQARGTLRWVAPELLDLDVHEDGMEDELPRVGPTMQSDAYSFGCIMLQILSGKVPYYYLKYDGQILRALLEGRTPKRPSTGLVTERRWKFMERCWSADGTESRPSSDEIVELTREEVTSARSSLLV